MFNLYRWVTSVHVYLIVKSANILIQNYRFVKSYIGLAYEGLI
jgi:hypothetical protein